jgi:hypothetical protein
MIDKYILRGKTPVPVKGLFEWGEWMQTADRRVAHDDIDGVSVSTVFLGLDHGFGHGAPKLFETMVFGLDDDYQERYSTWAEAEAGHARAVAIVRAQARDADHHTTRILAKLRDRTQS